MLLFVRFVLAVYVPVFIAVRGGCLVPFQEMHNKVSGFFSGTFSSLSVVLPLLLDTLIHSFLSFVFLEGIGEHR